MEKKISHYSITFCISIGKNMVGLGEVDQLLCCDEEQSWVGEGNVYSVCLFDGHEL